MKKIAIIAVAALLGGCVVEAPPRVVYVQQPTPPTYEQAQPAPDYQTPAPQPVVSVYVDPPLFQPPPIRVAWAPPPMLVDVPPPMPYPGAVWTGGYWIWEGNWVWAYGRWSEPPRPGYGWVNPYYENRGGTVVFVNGFWAAPGVSFVAPSLSINIAFGEVAVGVVAGPRPMGPVGVFVPAPPGSRLGLIVPAPVGTPPSVVTSAPPIIRGGMHINNNVTNNNFTNVHNVTNVTNITNVTIVAPASATANGQAVHASVPAQPHLAAAMPPVVKAVAPVPASARPVPTYTPGRPLVALPPAQVVHAEGPPALMRTQPHPMQPDQRQFNQDPQRPGMTRKINEQPHAQPAEQQGYVRPDQRQTRPAEPAARKNRQDHEVQHPPVNKPAAGNQGTPKPAPRLGAPKNPQPRNKPQQKKEGKKTDERVKSSDKHEEHN